MQLHTQCADDVAERFSAHCRYDHTGVPTEGHGKTLRFTACCKHEESESFATIHVWDFEHGHYAPILERMEMHLWQHRLLFWPGVTKLASQHAVGL